MRGVAGRGYAYQSTGLLPTSDGWPRAGFSSFAYRLAHLSLPRPFLICGVSLAFYLL